MRAALLLLTLSIAALAQTGRYELRGRLAPPTSASVWLHGTSSPFEDSTLTSETGRFRFARLPAGTYTLGAFVPAYGELRQTVEVGPSLADSRGRIEVRIDLPDQSFESQDSLRRRALVSTRDLAIPEQAYREFDAADQLADFLRYHPDSPDAARIRERMTELRTDAAG